MYKQKVDKVRLVDSRETNSSKLGGVLDWVAKSKETNIKGHDKKYPRWLIAKFSNIKRGSRLTKECLEKLIVEEGLMAQEKDVFIKMLYNREKALAFE